MFAPPQLAEDYLHDPIRLGDWVEINLLLEEEASVSVTGVADELADIPPDDSSVSERKALSWEAAEQRAEDVFGELSQRENWLGDRYPVELDGDVALLRQQVEARDCYRFLVLLRARQLYEDALGDDGEEAGLLFEDLVKHALGAYVGARSGHCVRFGVAGGSRGDRLPLPLSEAIQDLSRRMLEKPGEISGPGHDDYKADAIAWSAFGDRRPGQLVLIGQATISEDEWKRKQPASKWTTVEPGAMRLVDFVARPLTAVAFPETLSLTSSAELHGLPFSSVPFDRLRLLSVLSDGNLPADLRERMKGWGRGMEDRLRQR